jgi:deoxyribodipyrimidine photo-lyase
MRQAYEGFLGGAPASRVRSANDKPINPDGRFVLYWMIAARRPHWNFALDRAVAWAGELRAPLVVLEPLRVDYPFASDRLHRFVIDGMADNRQAFSGSQILYYPYVEPNRGAGKGLLARLARDASIIVTDDYPCFFLPNAVAAAAERVSVRLEAVDGNGLVPLSSAPRAYPAAVHYRRFMQDVLRRELASAPSSKPLAAQGGVAKPLESMPADVTERWPAASEALLSGDISALSQLPIDHEVPAVSMRGGWTVAERTLGDFVRHRLAEYHGSHNHPDDRGTSRLSPYLHFGHVAAYQVFDAVMRHERWNIGKLGPRATGAREGWWGVGQGAEDYLDQLVVWRELAFNTCAKRPDDYDRYESLPDWARQTLDEHARDARQFTYDRDDFERARTHDRVWNAAQNEMIRDGWMHNYMRMLWGKKILEWSASPREALHTMIALMNRWALDGRDPNSYAGYMWTLGKYDRPWLERPVYVTVRSMSSDSTMKKRRVRAYLAENERARLF